MTPAILNIMWLSDRSEAELLARLPVPIEIRRIKSARRMRLRYDDGRAILKLTCPPRTGRRAALTWAAGQREWIEAQLARAGPAEPLAPGRSIPFAGEDVQLHWDPDLPRTPSLSGGRISCGGPQAGFARRVESFLKRTALATMSVDAKEFARSAGVDVHGLSIGDARSRWGSCSSTGRIRMNWRLILAPPAVRRYVVAHEVAHLAHLNHGPAFRALEARLFGPGLADAKRALVELGPRLRRIGRGL